MSVPSKVHNIQFVQIQPEERLAATSEQNPASSPVTGCGEVRGMGYWATTQVKSFRLEIHVFSVADIVHLTEGSILITVSPNRTWRGDESLMGSETVAGYQTDIMGTREAPSVLSSRVCAIKSMNGKIVLMTLWGSDQFIVPEKQGNARGWKGMLGEPLRPGYTFCTLRQVKDGNKTGLITDLENDGVVLLKSWMRGYLKSGSLRTIIAASGQNNLKRRGI